MNKPQSVKELCEFIWYLENKYDLLNFEIEGVKPWQAFRIEIYYDLGKRCSLFEEHLQRGLTTLQKFKSLLQLTKNSLLHYPLRNLRKVDCLVFTHPRSKVVNQKYIDIYTHYLVEEFKKNSTTFFEVEEQFQGKHLRAYEKTKINIDYINLIRNIKTKFIKIALDDQQKTLILNVKKEISDILKSDYNLEKVLVTRAKKFIVTYDVYCNILKKTKPERVFIVVSYGRPELIKAAKKLNIETIELQHGTFSKYHLGYSYPDNKKMDYFPDKFYVWNEYWKDLMKFPIDNKSVIISPFTYLETEKQKYTSMTKIKGQTVVLCQAGLTDSMAEKILDDFDRFKDLKLIFKLHPEEYGRVNLYRNLQALLTKDTVSVVEDIDLYALFAQCEYQIGVFSTAIYEGKEFDCKTILINLPGIEYMDKFITHYNLEQQDELYIEL